MENLHSWHKLYTTAGRDGRDESQLCISDDLVNKKNRQKYQHNAMAWDYNRPFPCSDRSSSYKKSVKVFLDLTLKVLLAEEIDH